MLCPSRDAHHTVKRRGQREKKAGGMQGGLKFTQTVNHGVFLRSHTGETGREVKSHQPYEQPPQKLDGGAECRKKRAAWGVPRAPPALPWVQRRGRRWDIFVSGDSGLRGGKT